jgi:tetratricopeptide (TPR) repeat protein
MAEHKALIGILDREPRRDESLLIRQDDDTAMSADLSDPHGPPSFYRLIRVFGLIVVLAPAGSACRTTPAQVKQRHVQKADKYAAAGKYAEAIVEYRGAIQADPRAGDVRLKLAAAYQRVNDSQNAAGEYVRAADLLPNDTGLQLKAAGLLLLGGRIEDARARAEQVLAREPKNVDAQLIIANAQAGLKDLDGAVAQVEEALRIDPGRSDTYSHLGALELSRGRKEAAEAAFKKAIDLSPTSVEPRLALANFFWLTDRPAAAEQSLDDALAIDPKHALANRIAASFFIATNRRDKAELPLKTVFEVTRTPASALALAQYFVAVGKDDEAKSILEPLTKDAPTAAMANVRLATLDHKAGHPVEALQRLDGVLSRDHGNLDALLVKSMLLADDGKMTAALASARLAADRHPDSASAFFMVGRIEAARRQPDSAITAFQEVLRLNARATEAKIALGQLHLAQGRPDTSMALATEALASEPANGNAELLYVRSLLARGELNRAEAELKKLAARFPEAAAVHVQMGVLLGRKNQLHTARAEFERAVQLDPDSLEALAGLVALDLSSRDFKAARARVDARLEAATPTAPLLTLAARTYAASGDASEAEKALRRALSTDSSYLTAYALLGQLYASQHKLAAARAEFEALAERSSKPVVPLTMIGIILQAEGDEAGARERFEHALQIDPEAAVAANNLAWIYADKGGNLDVALQLAQTAQKHLHDVPEVNDTLGFIYYKKNLAPLAISTIKISAEKDPGNATYHYHLGLAYASAGDSARAKQSLARALQLSTEFDGARQARDLLNSLEGR